MSGSKPVEIFCDIGHIATTLDVVGGELIDNARASVKEPCPGCTRWNRARIEQVDQQLIAEYGSGAVNLKREKVLEQHLVDQARFVGGASAIVVAMCSPLGVEVGGEELDLT